MSPEEKAIDLEQANQRLSTMGLGTSSAEAKPVRAKRSDAGVPRKPKAVEQPQASAGVLTTAQRDRILELVNEKERRNLEQEAAVAHAEQCDLALANADKELYSYLDSLTGAGGSN